MKKSSLAGTIVAGLFGLVVVSSAVTERREAAEREKAQAEKARADSIMATQNQLRQREADSILISLDPRRIRAVDQAQLTFLFRFGSRSAAPETYAAVMRERERRADSARAAQARIVAESRADGTADQALAESQRLTTIDGGKCTRGTRARARELAVRNPSWSSSTIATVMCRMIVIGMTAEQLRASWGAPDRINRSYGAGGSSEQWVFGRTYVYVDNGVVRSWQDSR